MSMRCVRTLRPLLASLAGPPRSRVDVLLLRAAATTASDLASSPSSTSSSVAPQQQKKQQHKQQMKQQMEEEGMRTAQQRHRDEREAFFRPRSLGLHRTARVSYRSKFAAASSTSASSTSSSSHSSASSSSASPSSSSSSSSSSSPRPSSSSSDPFAFLLGGGPNFPGAASLPAPPTLDNLPPSPSGSSSSSSSSSSTSSYPASQYVPIPPLPPLELPPELQAPQLSRFDLTPNEIVAALDRHIIGQTDAKKAVALALRARWRKQQLPKWQQDELISPNLLLVGPTGSGKTEIARRIAKLCGSPMVKVEATRYTEVGVVGEDPEGMIHDLSAAALRLEMERQRRELWPAARLKAENVVLGILKVVKLDFSELLRSKGLPSDHPVELERMRVWLREGVFDADEISVDIPTAPSHGSGNSLPFRLGGGRGGRGGFSSDGPFASATISGSSLSSLLRDLSKLGGGGGSGSGPTVIAVASDGPDDHSSSPSSSSSSSSSSTSSSSSAPPGSVFHRRSSRSNMRRVMVPVALTELTNAEISAQLDHDRARSAAVTACERGGIIVIDEIDKLAHGDEHRLASSSVMKGEGVQKELLTLIEGKTVQTHEGTIDTSKILFLGSGAFYRVKPSALLPELQGRLPVRVALTPLTERDFERILVEPAFSLLSQQKAMLATEGIALEFTPEAVRAMAKLAARLNDLLENTGARRLQDVLSRVLGEISYDAPEKVRQERKKEKEQGKEGEEGNDGKGVEAKEAEEKLKEEKEQAVIPFVVDEAYVTKQSEALLRKTDLSRFVL